MTMRTLSTPVAFFVFNRPETTSRVFEVIRQAKPEQLFIIADAPRLNILNDIEKCRSVRSIVQKVDWDCEVLYNYATENLGCRDRMSSGIDWVFSQVECAIILEDDCLPNPSFFRYCDELLDYYKDDDRIFSISGATFQPTSRQFPHSYYFSKYPNIWGWATWRRAWKFYDVDMKAWEDIRNEKNLTSILPDWQARLYWQKKFQKVYKKEIDTWDFQWTFASFIQNGLHILPKHNLVSNIGFGREATHTKKISSLSGRNTFELEFPLKKPETMIRDYKADHFTDLHVYQCQLYQRVWNQILRLRS